MNAAYVPLLLSASALLISIVSFFVFRSYLKRRTGQERILAELREEVNGILQSINETVDRDISLVEEKEKTLKTLLEDIEKRVKLYIREMETRREADNAYSALSASAPKPDEKAVAQAAERAPAAEAHAGGTYLELGKKRFRGKTREPESAAEENRGTRPETETPKEAAAVPSGASPEPPPGPVPSVGEQIRSLMRAGLPSAAIASRLGISIAEVEFAAALLERRDTL